MYFIFLSDHHRRPGQLFEILELYPNKDRMPNWPFQDLSLKLKVAVHHGFNTKLQSNALLFAYIKHLTFTHKLYFAADQFKDCSDPELKQLFLKSNIKSWDCPPEKRECMMNIISMLGFIWVHPDNIDLHFGELLHSLWPEKKLPVGWNTYIEDVENHLMKKTLELYWNICTPAASEFIQRAYSIDNLRGVQDSGIHDIIKNDNPQNLHVIIGPLDKNLTSTQMSIANTREILKEPLSPQVTRFLQYAFGTWRFVCKVNGCLKDQCLEDATVMDLVAMPSSRF